MRALDYGCAMSALVEEYIAAVHEAYVDDRDGEVYAAVPTPTGVQEDAFGICLATGDGHVYEVGDTRMTFALQSISKPFTYGLALADNGLEHVDARIDVEPSGDSFNEISLEASSGRPRNAMINAGAIAAAALVHGTDRDERFARVRSCYSAWAGRDLAFDAEIFAAEMEIAHRHRAIGHLLRGTGAIDEDPELAVDLYFRQCSLLVDCRDLALMGATLANGGAHPRTGERVLAAEYVERVLSVMATCGMYDSAGEWLADVGMPAKSGLGGGIVAVLPGQVAIAVFSPRLDRGGNSVRATRACRRLSNELELHVLRVTRARRSAVRGTYDLRTAPSSLRRTPDEQAVLDEHGWRGRVYELHGDLLFAGAESVVRELTGRAPDLDVIILDVQHVDDVAAIARRMLLDARAGLDARACVTVMVDPDVTFPDRERETSPVFDDLDSAIAWAEDRIIETRGAGDAPEARIDLAEHPLVADFTPEDLEVLGELLEERQADAGEQIVAEGDPPAGIFLVVAGQASATTEHTGGARQVAVLRAGTSFGKRAVASGEPHATDVVADEPSKFLVLTPDAMATLEERAPHVVLALLRSMLAQAPPPAPAHPEDGESETTAG